MTPEAAYKLLEAGISPSDAVTAADFARHLANTVAACEVLDTANPQPESGGWLFYEAEIEGAASGLTGMAEAVMIMNAEHSPLLHAGMLECLPVGLLGRVLVAGFLCVSEEMLDLMEGSLEQKPGGSGSGF